MPFDLEAVKKHPYIAGTVVIVGGIIVFYLLSSSQSESGGSSSGSGDYASTLSADTQIAQIQAAAETAQSQTQAQLQAAQLSANSTDLQTQASLQANNINTAASLAAVLGQISGQVEENNSNNYSAITEQANEDVSNENIYGMQEAVLADQINAGVEENANNNATQLGAQEATLAANNQINTLGITDTYNLSQQQLADQQQTNQVVEGNLGTNASGSNEFALEETLLSGNNPGTATAGLQSTALQNSIASANTSNFLTSLIKGGTSIASGLLG